jgi:hypothetical protein
MKKSQNRILAILLATAILSNGCSVNLYIGAPSDCKNKKTEQEAPTNHGNPAPTSGPNPTTPGPHKIGPAEGTGILLRPKSKRPSNF